MRFDLFIDGKAHNVEVGIGRIVTVKLADEVFQAEARNGSEGTSVHLDGQDHIVRFEGPYALIDGHRHRIEYFNLRRGSPSWSHATGRAGGVGAGKPGDGKAGGEEIIYPPMPGSVVSVKVKQGDPVKVGSLLLVLEAMKMENEVVSPVDGTVREIRVSEGELVDSGDVLLVIGD